MVYPKADDINKWSRDFGKNCGFPGIVSQGNHVTLQWYIDWYPEKERDYWELGQNLKFQMRKRIAVYTRRKVYIRKKKYIYKFFFTETLRISGFFAVVSGCLSAGKGSNGHGFCLAEKRGKRKCDVTISCMSIVNFVALDVSIHTFTRAQIEGC